MSYINWERCSLYRTDGTQQIIRDELTSGTATRSFPRNIERPQRSRYDPDCPRSSFWKQLSNHTPQACFSAKASFVEATGCPLASGFATPFLRNTPALQKYFICAVTLGA